jgi:hypothetical protein
VTNRGAPGVRAREQLDLAILFPEMERIGDRRLRDIVRTVWEELWSGSAFVALIDVPVATNIPYPQVRHCQGVLRSALALADALESVHEVKFDRDVLIAGALLMDVSKLVEIRPDPAGGYSETEVGRALPHAFFTAQKALALGVPLAVVHIITTHSPLSGKPPMTPEAQLLSWLDQLDIGAFGSTIWTRQVMHHLA